MVGTDSYTRESDGTYSSSSGQQVSQGPGGELWSGGAPTGYRDIGFGIQRVPSAWETYQPTSYQPNKPQPYQPRPLVNHDGGVVVAGYPTAPSAPETKDGWSILCVCIYPWMLFLGVLAYVGVSASSQRFPLGLHLHPIYGVAAFFGTIWLYRQLMTLLPTALALALPAALLSGVLAWALSDGPAFRQFVEGDGWKTLGLSRLWAMTNGWVIAAMSLNLAAHAAYWWYRRKGAQHHGWVFTRAPLDTAKELLTLALLSGGIGWAIGYFG